MTWRSLLAEGKVERHVATRQELDDLRRAVRRNLEDAALGGLSADNRFGLAYEAAFLIAKMAVAAAGYRVKGPGTHRTIFLALELALPRGRKPNTAYLDRCRRKRNDLHYEVAGIATTAEGEELIREAIDLLRLVEAWIERTQPSLRRISGRRKSGFRPRS